MTFFSRRTLQRLLNENQIFLTSKQSNDHLARLNSSSENAFLSVEWEIVTLNVLNKVGTVDHERRFSGRHPDVFFRSRLDSSVQFVADIVTVTDEGLELEQPLKAFEREFDRHLQRSGLRLNSFNLTFNASERTKYRVRPILKIPPKEKFHSEFFNARFKSFIEQIHLYPNEPAVYIVLNESTDIRLDYNPSQKYSSTKMPAFDIAYDMANNTVFKALKAKAAKLRKTKYQGARGIILCDGGSAIFHFRKTDPQRIVIGIDSVIGEFFRQNTSVAFVLVIVIETSRDRDRHSNYVTVELYENSSSPEMGEGLRRVLTAIERFFPTPVSDTRSAMSSLKKYGKLKEGWSFYTRLPMNGMDDVRISSRALIGLLAGELNQQTFLEDHGLIPNRENTLPFQNPFAFNLSKGKLLTNIEVERSSFEDDDFVRFRFGNRDAAISRFQLATHQADSENQFLLVGDWRINLDLLTNIVALRFSIRQDHSTLSGQIEVDGNVDYFVQVENAGTQFKLELASFVFNNQLFDVDLYGEIDEILMSGQFSLQSPLGPKFSFPFRGRRL